MLLAPLDAHVPSDAKIWAMLGLPPPVRERVAKELDQPRPSLLMKIVVWS